MSRRSQLRRSPKKPTLYAIGWAAPYPTASTSFVSLLPATGLPILVSLSAESAARANGRRDDPAVVARAMAALRVA